MTMNEQADSIEPPSSTVATAETRRPGGLRRWLRGWRNGRNGGSNVRETLEELIEQHEEREAPIEPRERQLIERILNVGGVTVDDAMVPRADIVAVECRTPFDDVIDLMARETHSRLPVYRESLDEVIGMVHIKDVLFASVKDKGRPTTLPEIVRPVLFVAPSMRVLDLLLQMRLSRMHMALVVDEYGGVDGLITIEDTVEQIVGEIEDEHDEVEEPMIVERDDGSFEADARTEIAEFEAQFNVDLLPDDLDDEIDTLGGLLFSMMGRVPRRGDKVRHDCGLEFEVTEADPRRISRLRVRRVPAVADAEG